MAAFVRTDLSDGAEETLIIVESATRYYSTWLDAETPYLVQVTQGEHFAGLFDLDGDAIHHTLTWQIAEDATLPPAVLAAVEDGWARGSYVVARQR